MSNSLLNCVPYMLSFPTCLMPHAPRALRASCPTCSRGLRALCTTCPRALSALCLTCLVPYMSFALPASCKTYSRVSRVIGALVPQMSFALRVLGLLVPWTLRALLLLIQHLLQVFQPYHTLIHHMSCSFHALCLLCFCCFSCLRFLQSGLRLIIRIDSSKVTLNINDINTLYPLRIAIYVKNEFQNLQTGFKNNWRGLGYV